MKYAVDMGSGAIIYSYIPSLIEIYSSIQQLMRGDRYIDTASNVIHKPTFIFPK
jgi:hypothetical protein